MITPRSSCLIASFVVVTVAPLGAQRPAPAGAPTGAAAARPVLRVGGTNGPLRLDGVLAEPAWSSADSIANLTQIEPVEGGAPTGRTVVRVVASGDAIIVGVRADDPEPTRITSFARERDAALGNEDPEWKGCWAGVSCPVTHGSSDRHHTR